MFWVFAQADVANQDGVFHQSLSFLQNVFANPIAISLVFSLSVVIVTVLVKYRYKLRKTEIEASLKHAMIERGMSADEIERVLAAKADSTPKTGDLSSTETAVYPAAKLK